MQGKLFQKRTQKKSMKYSGHKKLLYELSKLFRDQRIHVPSDILRWFVGTFLLILCTHFDRQIKNSGFIQISMFNYKIT